MQTTSPQATPRFTQAVAFLFYLGGGLLIFLLGANTMTCWSFCRSWLRSRKRFRRPRRGLSMDLSEVSRTAILTLLGHVVASQKEDIDFKDPMAVLCLERLVAISSADEKKWIIRQKRMLNTSRCKRYGPQSGNIRQYC